MRARKLDRLEGLAQVVVGPQLEPHDPVDHLGTRGEHEDGDLHAALAQVAADVEAVLARQHDIQEDEVERLFHRPGDGGVAVGGRLDPVALGHQSVGEGEDEARLVLDEEDAVGGRGRRDRLGAGTGPRRSRGLLPLFSAGRR